MEYEKQMMNMGRISVIIPVYQVEKYLHKCIDSVKAQTYSNLEIILIDDGSPDGCGKICDEYASADPRIKVIHQENRGVSVARNAGLAAATGEYIAFVDSDDYIDPDMMEKLHAALITQEADIAECGYRRVTQDGIVDRENTDLVTIYSGQEAVENLFFEQQAFKGLSVVIWNKLYRAEIIKHIRFAEGLNCEDCLYTPMAYLAADRIVKLNQNLYNYYLHSNSFFHSNYNVKKTDAVKIQKLVAEFYLEQGKESLFLLAQEKYFNELFHHYYECRKRKREKVFARKAKVLYQEISEQYPNMLKNSRMHKQAWKAKLCKRLPACWFALMWVWRLCQCCRAWIRSKIGNRPRKAQ